MEFEGSFGYRKIILFFFLAENVLWTNNQSFFREFFISLIGRFRWNFGATAKSPKDGRRVSSHRMGARVGSDAQRAPYRDRVPPHRMGARVGKFWTKTPILGGGNILKLVFIKKCAFLWRKILMNKRLFLTGFFVPSIGHIRWNFGELSCV